MTIDFNTTFSYLEKRGQPYGIGLKEMLNKTPSSILDDPSKIIEFWQNKDISHILPISTHPDLAADPNNWFPEDISENRSAQDTPRDLADILEANIDNNLDIIDMDYDDDGILDVNY
jgi:hypothetical protein